MSKHPRWNPQPTTDNAMPQPCPECGTPDIRRVGNKVQLKCEHLTVEADSGPETVRLWNETL